MGYEFARSRKSGKNCGSVSCTPQLRFPLQTRCPAQQPNQERIPRAPEAIGQEQSVCNAPSIYRATHGHPANRFLRNVRMDHEPGARSSPSFTGVRLLRQNHSNKYQKQYVPKIGDPSNPFQTPATPQGWFHLAD